MAISYIKVVLTGDASVGKTELLHRILHGSSRIFTNVYQFTIGADCKDKEIAKDQSFRFWDIAGNKEFQAEKNKYYNDAKVVLYCVDLSQDSVQYQSISENIGIIKNTIPKPQVLLIGTKVDNHLKKIKEDFPDVFTDYILTSSKDYIGIEEVDKTLKQLVGPNAKLIKALNELYTQINQLPETIKEKLTTRLNSFLQKPSIQQFDCNTLEDIQAFKKDCFADLRGKHALVKKSLLTFITIFLAAILGAAIGFVLGLAAGACFGPGVFFTAVAGASVGMKAGIASGAAITVGAAAVVSNYTFFKKTKEEKAFEAKLDGLPIPKNPGLK